jgi:two-component system response regulator TctD
MRIFLVEDDVELATWLIKALEQSGLVIEWASDGLVAEKILSIEEFDAIILDLGLHTKPGHSVLKYLRARGDNVPVMILTARDSIEERVNCLNSGADDFMAKPFALPELEARLRALIRRCRTKSNRTLTCGALTLDSEVHSFKVGNVPLILTPREHAMLTVLIYRAGEPVSKQALMDRIFTREQDVSPEAIEVLAFRLRKKLGTSMVRIVTMRGFGYCLEECCATGAGGVD